ncbi:hypothetical protein GCM10011529_04050 [Polymorphobacter glacialis]|uniref:Molybdenum cofactor guanylyltransferase n=1 Tax=Sandarakinorhabdus glacialis TaxID=1614636 RepID=A0A916ZJP8_9SPHN|nr:molybdenum cofactor guanylyltransferase [Polymorphobacter glacialis]GGE00968.1 hypothetical protein GCM10011529_04050 [Polymorphobacter glacialis]
MRLLGAVLAGGKSSRFGSDKALARHQGVALIDHVINALAREAGAVVVVGRDYPNMTGIPDWPNPGLGPLGGLCAALRHAAATGYNHVLTAGCDLPNLPPDLARSLSPAPAYALGQPTIGLWPTTLASALGDHILAGNRSVHGWAEACYAHAIDLGKLANINTAADLAALR